MQTRKPFGKNHPDKLLQQQIRLKKPQVTIQQCNTDNSHAVWTTRRDTAVFMLIDSKTSPVYGLGT